MSMPSIPQSTGSDVALDDATTASAAASSSRPNSANASSSPRARRLWPHAYLDDMSEKEGRPNVRYLRQQRKLRSPD